MGDEAEPIESISVSVSADEVFSEGEDLCIHCLKPIGYNANFCIHCRAPLGFLAGTVPFYSVFAEGFIWRSAIGTPKSLLTVLGVWLIFGNYLGMGIWLSWVTFSTGVYITNNWLNFYFSVMYGGMFAMGLAGVVQSTRNYLNYRNS